MLRKGVKASPETREKMRVAHTGKLFSEEHKASLSAALKGHAVSDETKAKIRAPQVGKLFPDEYKAKLCAAQKGHIVSGETKARISTALIGKPHACWVTMSKEDKVMRLATWTTAGHVAAWKTTRATTIEVAVAAVLDALGVEYRTQERIGRYCADIYIPSRRLVIECDGDYWHTLPGVQERDQKRDDWFRSQGYQVVRLWESDIRNDANSCVAAAMAVI